MPSTGNRGFNPFGGAVRSAIRHDDYVICGDPESYQLNVTDPSGKQVMQIIKDFNPVEITEEEIEEVKKEFPKGYEMTIPKYHNPFRWLIADDEGRIYVMTYERVEGTEELYYDVFDLDGKYIAKIPLKSRPRVVKKNKLYTVESDEEGFLTVKRYRIDWNI